MVSSLASLLQETCKHFSITCPSRIYNEPHGVYEYPAWFLMPCGAVYSDINLTTFCRCLNMGELKASQKLLNFCQIKQHHIPDDTTLNFIIAAGTTSRPPDEVWRHVGLSPVIESSAGNTNTCLEKNEYYENSRSVFRLPEYGDKSQTTSFPHHEYLKSWNVCYWLHKIRYS